MLPVFDSHTHVVSPDVQHYPPAPVHGALRPGAMDDPVTAERLVAALDAEGVARAVLVQRGTVYGHDNRYVLDTLARWPQRFAAVCCVDGRAPDVAGTVRRLVREQGVAGFRLMPPAAEARADWIASDDNAAVWQAAQELGASICVFLLPPSRAVGMAGLLQVLQRHPQAGVVVDHVSNPPLAEPGFGFDDALRRLADHAGVTVKFSTVNIRRCQAAGVDAAGLLQAAVVLFGAERVMWGSDIGQTAGAYEDMVDAVRAAAAGLTVQQQRAVLHDTAARVYGAAVAR